MTIITPLAMLTSCAEQMEMMFSTPVRLTATTESFAATRSSASADLDFQTSAFENGETINGYFSDSDGNVLGDTPTKLTASTDGNGKKMLLQDPQIYYPGSSGTSVNVYALYPDDVKDNTSSFTVKNDQSSNNLYKASDLMYASGSNLTRTTDDVNLPFRHKMAKVIVTATGEGDILITKIRLVNVCRTIEMTPATGELGNLVTTNVYEDNTIILATNNDGEALLSGAALMPPQTISADFIEVSVKYNYGTSANVKEGKAIFSLNGKSFSGGTQYTANVTVTRQNIDFTTTITDWTADQGTILVVPNSGASLSIGNIQNKTYTGSVIRPKPDITYIENSEEKPLAEGTDYELAYFNNTNVGTATIIITGKKTSEYEILQNLTALKSFYIEKHEGYLEYTSPVVNTNYEFNAVVDNVLKKKKEDSDPEGDGVITYSSTDESVATVSESGIVTLQGLGSTKITASMDDSGNFEAATAGYTLNVSGRPTSNLTVNLYPSSYVYDGTAHTPSVIVTDGGRTLKKGTDYDYTITDNTNAGKGKVTVSGMGNYAGDYVKEFTISQHQTEITMDDTNVTMAIDSKIMRPASTSMGTLVLSSSSNSIATISESGELEAKAEGTATITATIKETSGNFTSPTKTYTVTVKNADNSFAYTGSVQSWPVPVTGIYQVEVSGAQGASTTYDLTNDKGAPGISGTGEVAGGFGAHIVGRLRLTEGTTLYIYVGGQGATGGVGGWNGGGSLTGTNSGYKYCGGGGASDISLVGGNWDSSTHLNSRIIVAGGGGGALAWVTTPKLAVGGYAGAETLIGGNGGGGNPGNGGGKQSGGTAGTNGESGSFGKGGNYEGTSSAGMGGGGWYGGGSGGDSSTHGSGGGGSSYVWNAGNASLYPSGKSNLVTSDYYITTLSMNANRTGNGEVKITYISAE